MSEEYIDFCITGWYFRCTVTSLRYLQGNTLPTASTFLTKSGCEYVWVRRVDVTVSNDSAILYDCLITVYWHKGQLYKSVLGRFKSECNKTITSCPSGQFNLERVSLQIASVTPLYLLNKNALWFNISDEVENELLNLIHQAESCFFFFPGAYVTCRW